MFLTKPLKHQHQLALEKKNDKNDSAQTCFLAQLFSRIRNKKVVVTCHAVFGKGEPVLTKPTSENRFAFY